VETACFDVQGADRVTELESLVSRLGGLDILVISAGIGLPADDLSWELDKCTIDTNVEGFTALANWGFNHFVRQGHGQLAAISSVAAHRGGSLAPAYNASKAYQSNYLEGLAIKAHRMKLPITITVTEPGFVNTRMALGDGLFWVVPVDKAARQIIRAIEGRKRRAFISRRWALIARIMRLAPFSLYRRFV
jgi:short-subunit dehydrogenase